MQTGVRRGGENALPLDETVLRPGFRSRQPKPTQRVLAHLRATLVLHEKRLVPRRHAYGWGGQHRSGREQERGDAHGSWAGGALGLKDGGGWREEDWEGEMIPFTRCPRKFGSRPRFACTPRKICEKFFRIFAEKSDFARPQSIQLVRHREQSTTQPLCQPALNTTTTNCRSAEYICAETKHYGGPL